MIDFPAFAKNKIGHDLGYKSESTNEINTDSVCLCTIMTKVE